MKRNKLISLLLLSLMIFGIWNLSLTSSNALGGLLKNIYKKDSTAQTTEDKSNKTKTEQSKSAEPVEYKNPKYHYTLNYPGNWVLKDDDPKKSVLSIVDETGSLGSLSVNSTWMSDNFPVEPAFKALVDKAQQRQKHGEVESFYIKNYSVKGKNGKDYDVVKGVVIIESDIDPDYKRMQWEAYGGGNYYNFTTCSTVANFPKYKDKFKAIIDSIKFDFVK